MATCVIEPSELKFTMLGDS